MDVWTNHSGEKEGKERGCCGNTKGEERNKGVDGETDLTTNLKSHLMIRWQDTRGDESKKKGENVSQWQAGERKTGNQQWGHQRPSPRLTVPCRCTWGWPPSGCSVHCPPAEGATSPLLWAAGPPRPECRCTASAHSSRSEIFYYSQAPGFKIWLCT